MMRRDRLVPALLFAAIVAFGVWLRLDQITQQIIVDDEWHTLRCLVANDYREVFLHFGISDHCIPMTLLAKYISDTVGLSELAMRVLPLASGIAALFVLPWILLPRFGVKTTLIFATLLAISPLHVYFSRYARPYAPIFLLGLAGVLAFERYLSGGSRRWLWIYVVCAILAPWFHPFLLPFVLAPLGFALVHELPDRARVLARLRELWPYALLVAIGSASLILPPLITDFESMRERSGMGTVDEATFIIGYDLFSGTSGTLTGLLFGAASLAGLAWWCLYRRAWLAYIAFPTVAVVAAIAYSRPTNIGVPITAVRYMLPILGFWLLLAAEGLTRIDEFLRTLSRGLLPRHLVAPVVCAAFVGWSPIVSPLNPQNAVYYRPNAYTNHAFFQYQYSPEDRTFWSTNIRPYRISSFYRELAKETPGKSATAHRIVEAPWCAEWPSLPFNIYQRLHRWPVTMGFVHQPNLQQGASELPWPDDRFRFRNFVDVFDFAGLRRMRIAYVVIHKNLKAEFPYGTQENFLPLGPVIRNYTKRYGPPYFEDDDLVVFDVQARS